MQKKTFITNSFQETQKLGRDFVDSISFFRGSTPKATVIALHGDLGGGKTTFVQGLAGGLGIKKRIISPTFIIVRSYKIENKNVILATQSEAWRRPESKGDAGQASMTNVPLLVFYHIDLYRIEREKDIEGLGIEEIINDPNNIVAIEWAEKLGSGLPKKRWDIKFEYLDEDKRRITIAKLT